MTTPASDTNQPVAITPRPYYWRRFTTDRRPPGNELAALRCGINREAGTVPALWPYYTTLTEDGRRTQALLAEHLALTLFAVHQQSRNILMHHDGTGLGTAILRLKRSGTYSEDAVDRRFAAAATATSLTELAVHLRGLVTQLRGIGQPLDYTRLTRDLRNWQSPERVPGVRRRWGGQYFAAAKPGDDDTTATSTEPPATT